MEILNNKQEVYSVAWLCPTLCIPMDHSPPGSSVHGIFQVRIAEQVAMSYSKASSQRSKFLSLVSPALAGRFFFFLILTLVTPGSPEQEVQHMK